LYPSIEWRKKRECNQSWKNKDKNIENDEIFFKKLFSFIKRFAEKDNYILFFIKINKIYTNYIYKLYFNIYIKFIYYLLIVNINFHIIIK